MICIQNVSGMRIPPHQVLKDASSIVLKHFMNQAEINIRITDDKESAQLNAQYRQKKKATNVLAFPLQDAGDIFLGDLVLCVPVIKQEAIEQNKSLSMHFSHMIVHGTLHLLGWDHKTDTEAERMEALEIKFLKALGFSNPYLI